MSIKTSKRIALGVIASLVFAPFAAIAPASAAAITSTNVTATATAGSQTVGTVGTIGTATCAGPGANAADDTVAIVVSGPAGAVVTVTELCDDVLAHGTTNVVTVASSGTVSGNISEESTMATTANAAIKASFSMPGLYTVGIGGDTDTISVRVLPSSSLTSSITATAALPVYSVGDSPVVRVVRNVGGLLADGTLLLRVDATPDGDLTVGQILGEAVDTGVTAAVFEVNGRAFTFATATFATAGTYTFTAFADTNANNVLDAGEPTAAVSFVIGAASAATSLISATLSETVRAGVDGFRTFTITATVTDSLGRPTAATVYAAETTALGAAVTANTNNGYTNVSNAISTDGTLLARVGTTNTYTGTFSVDTAYTADDYFDTYITVYTNLVTAPNGAIKALRIANTTGLMSTTSGTTAFEILQAASDTPVGTVTDGVRQSLSSGVTGAAAAVTATVDRTHATHNWKIYGASGQEGEYLRVTVTPFAAGVSSATAAATPTTVVAPASYLIQLGADLVASTSVVATSPSAGHGYTIVISDGTNTATGTITFATAAPTWSVSPANFKAKFGDKVAVTGTLADQFGRPQATKDVNVVVTGRNAGTYIGKTDASGKFRFEWTDASTSTVVLTDSLVFNYSYLASATATTTTPVASSARVVTYSATGPAVATIVVSAPSATTTRPIDFGQSATGDPRTASTVVYTATLTKADGTSVGSGVLVTFKGGADDMFVESAERVTGADGTATITVYRQKSGASSITATSDGKTSTAGRAITWSNRVMTTGDTGSTALLASSARVYARYITLTADPASSAPEGIIRFVAKVTDRFGNPVEGVEITFSETGVGRFMANQTNPANTNALGEIAIDLSTAKSETGTVNVSALISDAAAVQKDDVAGFVQLIGDAATTAAAIAAAGTRTAIAGVAAAVKSASATATVANPTVPVVVIPPVAPTLTGSLNGRVLLFGSCQADEGDLIVYVKSPGKTWQERAKTFECAAGEFDGSIRAPKSTKFYRVKQEGTGLWSSSVLIRR